MSKSKKEAKVTKPAILVTGGAGSIGSALTEYLVKNMGEEYTIRVFDNNEYGIWHLRERLKNPNLRFLVGNVRDYARLKEAMFGVKHVFHCVPPDTMIISNDAPTQISNLDEHETVLTHNGEFREITSTMKRNVSEEVAEIQPWFTNIPLVITKEHPVLVWSPSKHCPNSYRKRCSPACGAKARKKCPLHFEKDGLQWLPAGEIQEGDFIVYPRLKPETTLQFSPELFCLIGFYLAEGCLGSKQKGVYYSVRFCFGKHEHELIAEVKSLILSCFGKEAASHIHRTGVQVTFCNKAAATFFSQFGKTAKTKILPTKFLLAPKEHIRELLLGYYHGDGSLSNGKMSTVSKKLAYQLRLLFHKIGIPVRLHKYQREGETIEGRKILCHPHFQIAISKASPLEEFQWAKIANNHHRFWIDEDYVYTQVRRVKRKLYRGPVMNLSVEGDETYCAEGIVTHNCAALKHVALCEFNPFDAVETNVIGTQNTIRAAFDTSTVEKFLYISTDKAVNPTSMMGASKLIGERLVLAANYIKGNRKIMLSSARFPNVMETAGNVFEAWDFQYRTTGKLLVRDPDMTRFFIHIDRAVDFLMESFHLMSGGEIFFPALSEKDQKRIIDVAKDWLKQKQYDDAKIVYGTPEFGEKKEEELHTKPETPYVIKASPSLYVIRPPTYDFSQWKVKDEP